MRQLLFIVTVLLSACGTQTTDQATTTTPEEETVETPKAAAPVEEVAELYDFNYDEFLLDSLNTYGGGDCYGTVHQFSLDIDVIGIDSMSCGEYGFTIKKMLFSDDKLQIAHIQESSTLLDADTPETSYELTETYVDFTKSPVLFLTRKEAVNAPDFDLIQKAMSAESLPEGLLESLSSAYQESWEATEEY